MTMTRLEALHLIRNGVAGLITLEVMGMSSTAGAAPAPSRSRPTVTVSGRDELWNAVKAARPGSTIALAPGVHSDLKLQNFKFSGEVTITSADRAKPAQLTDIMVRGCDGLTFRDLELVVDKARGSEPFKWMNCARVTLDRLHIHGSLDGDSSNDTAGMNVRSSSDVLVTNCRFEQLANAITQLDNQRIRLADNYFYQIRMDGIRGGGSSDVIIEDNFFTEFQPLKGDHGDAVQVWTTNTTQSAERILIRRNVVVQGKGGAVQGIFVTMQKPHRYQHVEITDNLIIGGLTNGITVAGADGVKITDNVVAAVGLKTWIRMENLTGLTLTGNRSNSYYKAGLMEIATEAKNTKLPPVKDQGVALLATRGMVGK